MNYPLNEPSQARRAEICGRALRRKRTKITGIKALRESFWAAHPQYTQQFKNGQQNRYSTEPHYLCSAISYQAWFARAGGLG